MLQERSDGSVKIISLDRDKVIAALQTIAANIYAYHPEVKSLHLFGSIARSDQVGISDADVLIILRGSSEENPLDLIKRFYAYFDLPIGVDLLVMGEEQLAQRLSAGDPSMTRIWNESQPLYD